LFDQHHIDVLIAHAAADSGEGAILPTWTAVDTGNVKTSRELWGFMKNDGWNVDVSFSLSLVTATLTWR